MEEVFPYIPLAALWIAYFIVHSFLATTTVKTYLYEKFPVLKKYYHLAYNVFSLITAIAIFAYQWSLPELTIIQPNVFSLFLGAVLIFAGVVVGGFALFSFDQREFIGIRQLVGDENQSGELITSGVYSIVRHPLYFSLILIVLGYLVYSFHLSNLIFASCTFIYLIIGTRLKEKKLLQTFGKPYKNYRKKVKMLIPFVF